MANLIVVPLVPCLSQQPMPPDLAHQASSSALLLCPQASKLKSALFPVAGAIVGGALGGPVGLAAGIKLGGLAAVGGGLAGE